MLIVLKLVHLLSLVLLAAGHEYQRGYRNIKDAVRIFFVLRKSVNAEEMFRDHPVGYDEPRIIKRYRNVDIWLSTAN